MLASDHYFMKLRRFSCQIEKIENHYTTNKYFQLLKDFISKKKDQIEKRDYLIELNSQRLLFCMFKLWNDRSQDRIGYYGKVMLFSQRIRNFLLKNGFNSIVNKSLQIHEKNQRSKRAEHFDYLRLVAKSFKFLKIRFQRGNVGNRIRFKYQKKLLQFVMLKWKREIDVIGHFNYRMNLAEKWYNRKILTT